MRGVAATIGLEGAASGVDHVVPDAQNEAPYVGFSRRLGTVGFTGVVALAVLSATLAEFQLLGLRRHINLPEQFCSRQIVVLWLEQCRDGFFEHLLSPALVAPIPPDFRTILGPDSRSPRSRLLFYM